MIGVYHNKNFLKRQFEQDKQTLIIDRKEAVPVAVVNTDDLGVAYQKTQNIVNLWVHNEGVIVNNMVRNGTRSTSVGDFLVRDNILYAVAAAGFVQLSNAYDVYRNENDAAKGIGYRYMTTADEEEARRAAKAIGGGIIKKR